MTSLTRIDQAVASGRRHGRSLACAAYQRAITAAWSGGKGTSHRSGAAAWRRQVRADESPEAAVTAPAGRPAKPGVLSHTASMGETPPQETARAAVYWRRRMLVLIVSMSVLAGITWSAAIVVGAVGRASRAGGGHPGLAAQASPPVSSTAASSGVRGNVAADSGAAVPVGRSCPVADVVVTLSATQASYSAWQQPQFAVDVVSSASYPCSFDIGAGHVLLQISAGTAHVWTSADCAEGLASQPTTLQRSVPAVVPMTWDEQYSSVGCPVPGRAASAGSYTASATDGSATSNDVAFTIG
jgi:hypothetical protein